MLKKKFLLRKRKKFTNCVHSYTKNIKCKRKYKFKEIKNKKNTKNIGTIIFRNNLFKNNNHNYEIRQKEELLEKLRFYNYKEKY